MLSHTQIHQKKWEPQCPSSPIIQATVSPHQLLSLQARLVTRSLGVLCPAHSSWLNSKSILTEAVPMHPTPAKQVHTLVPTEPAQEDSGSAQWCMASSVANPWPNPHSSPSAISQHCANKGSCHAQERLHPPCFSLGSGEGFELHYLHIAKC